MIVKLIYLQCLSEQVSLAIDDVSLHSNRREDAEPSANRKQDAYSRHTVPKETVPSSCMVYAPSYRVGGHQERL